MATTVADEKKNLRAILIACRDALTGGYASAMSEGVERRVLASESYRAASAVVLYSAIGHEVSTDRISADAIASGRAIFYPRIDTATGTIVARRIRDRAELARGAYGILEPPASADVLDRKVLRKFSSVFPALPSDSKDSGWAVAEVIMIVSSASSAAKRSRWGSPIHSSCSIESPRRDSTGGLTSLSPSPTFIVPAKRHCQHAERGRRR